MKEREETLAKNLRFLKYLMLDVYDDLLTTPLGTDDEHRINLVNLRGIIANAVIVLNKLGVKEKCYAGLSEELLKSVVENISTVYEYVDFETNPELSLKDNALLRVEKRSKASEALDVITETITSSILSSGEYDEIKDEE